MSIIATISRHHITLTITIMAVIVLTGTFRNLQTKHF